MEPEVMEERKYLLSHDSFFHLFSWELSSDSLLSGGQYSSLFYLNQSEQFQTWWYELTQEPQFLAGWLTYS